MMEKLTCLEASGIGIFVYACGSALRKYGQPSDSSRGPGLWGPDLACTILMYDQVLTVYETQQGDFVGCSGAPSTSSCGLSTGETKCPRILSPVPAHAGFLFVRKV